MSMLKNNYYYNIREEIFGATVFDLVKGKRYYIDKKELANLYNNELLPSDICREFELNPYEITADIINEIYKEDNLILDAVHSNLEWEIIKMMIPNAKLVEFVIPKKVREERWISKCKLDAKDSSRIKYWHNPNGVSKCLISDVDCVFNCVLPNELNLLCFEEFISFSNSSKYNDLDIEKDDIYDRILMMKGLRK